MIEQNTVSTLALRMTHKEFASGFFIVRGVSYRTLTKRGLEQLLILVRPENRDGQPRLMFVPVAMLAQIPSLGRMKCNYLTFDPHAAVPYNDMSGDLTAELRSKMNPRTMRHMPAFGRTDFLSPTRINEMDFGQVLGALDTMYKGKRAMTLKIGGQQPVQTSESIVPQAPRPAVAAVTMGTPTAANARPSTGARAFCADDINIDRK